VKETVRHQSFERTGEKGNLKDIAFESADTGYRSSQIYSAFIFGYPVAK
jgi:hypothetical protein